MEFLRRLVQQLREIWRGMSAALRVALAVLAAVCLVVVLAVAFWSAQVQYVVLYSGLSLEDAGAVTRTLTERDVGYRLEGGGTRILVRADKVLQLRLDLAREGLPVPPGKGFALFDESDLGATPFKQNVNFLRAQQDELARTIMRLDPVASARVHIARPEPSPFIRTQRPTTASVQVTLKPGQTMSHGQAASIVALVARAVEGLAPENIALVDDRGRTLTPPSGAAGIAASAQDFRNAQENLLAARAEEMLTRALGPDRAMVRVSADIELKHNELVKETYGDRVLESEEVKTSKTTGGAPGVGGITGVRANVPSLPGGQTRVGAGTGAGAASTSQDEEIKTTYRIPKTTETVKNGFGTIKRLTVAAMVDLSPPADGAAPSRMTLADARAIIERAVGFDALRGDLITVTPVPLAIPEKKEKPAEVPWWQTGLTVVSYSSLAVVALALLLLAWLLLRRPTAPTETEEVRVLRERLVVVGRRSPQVLARLLRSWLEESPREPTA